MTAGFGATRACLALEDVNGGRKTRDMARGVGFFGANEAQVRTINPCTLATTVYTHGYEYGFPFKRRIPRRDVDAKILLTRRTIDKRPSC